MKAIQRVITEMVPVNMYLVTFDTIWGQPCNPGEHNDCLEHGCMDNEPSYVAEIDPAVIQVTAANYTKLQENVVGRDADWNADGVNGDTHDLRPRLFRTRKEANAHVKYTTERFKNPQPWESFIKF